MHSSRRSLTLLGALLTACSFSLSSARAQDAPVVTAPQSRAETARPIPYDSVSEAFERVRARGDASVLVREDGWTIISFPNNDVWSFVPKGHDAYPAVVKRSLSTNAQGETYIDMAVLCTGDQNACARLVHGFEAENRQNVQDIQPPLPPHS